MSDVSYKSNEALTYSTISKINVGSIVQVPIKNKLVLGFVVDVCTKPKFKTKSIEKVYATPPIPSELIDLAQWLLYFYPSSIGVVSQLLLPLKMRDLQQESTISTLNTHVELPPLTAEQSAAVEKIKIDPETWILHGETGSGKTRVYVELTKKTLAANKSVLILTPEIGLTPQLVKTFTDSFGQETVIVTHSKLTPLKRQVAWIRILASKSPNIVIGPRSALFSPIANLGLIVIDESHEPSYKQDQMPHYLTTRVASKLAELYKIPLILGSATPSIVDYYYAEVKHRPVLRMLKPAKIQTRKELITVETVDMKNRSNFTKSRFISDQIIAQVRLALDQNNQSLLFLNRRGTARTILCSNCGWQAVCPNCDLPLTYHGDQHRIQCHTCGFKQHPLSACPVCQNTDIILKNIGTKFIVDEITSLFQQANIQRFDADNSKSEGLEQNFYKLQSGEIDILVGTQILAKGLDLPKLATVGVINADTSLYFPDYTASERTFQLIRQVIGRVGRGHLEKTSIVVQSYDPENVILRAALNGDWETYYKSEITERKKFGFPPFCFLLKLTCRRASSTASEKTASQFAQKISELGMKVEIDGPSPSFHEKIGNKYQWQLVVKAKNRNDLLKIIATLPSGWSFDIDPLNLL
ncbi:MAG TPA: primosomal protein N' [Candidatus Saccharimonadales bacterium]|nr:primosomal protein N' [Candidatus Saccharimonadales bacterium]